MTRFTIGKCFDALHVDLHGRFAAEESRSMSKWQKLRAVQCDG
jgi:hypothetical protein